MGCPRACAAITTPAFGNAQSHRPNHVFFQCCRGGRWYNVREPNLQLVLRCACQFRPSPCETTTPTEPPPACMKPECRPTCKRLCCCASLLWCLFHCTCSHLYCHQSSARNCSALKWQRTASREGHTQLFLPHGSGPWFHAFSSAGTHGLGTRAFFLGGLHIRTAHAWRARGVRCPPSGSVHAPSLGPHTDADPRECPHDIP